MELRKCIDYIRSDYYRSYGGVNHSLLKMLLKSIFDVGFLYLFWYRLSYCDNSFIRLWGRLASRLIGMHYHIVMERNMKLGYGIRLVHGGPVVINCSAVIGDNVDIYQFTTIGSNSSRAAQIGNEVYIGPSVCIVENVRIGNGVTIGAGAVVVKDVESGVTIAGNPAHVISTKKAGRFVNRKWNREWNKVK